MLTVTALLFSWLTVTTLLFIRKPRVYITEDQIGQLFNNGYMAGAREVLRYRQYDDNQRIVDSVIEMKLFDWQFK